MRTSCPLRRQWNSCGRLAALAVLAALAGACAPAEVEPTPDAGSGSGGAVGSGGAMQPGSGGAGTGGAPSGTGGAATGGMGTGGANSGGAATGGSPATGGRQGSGGQPGQPGSGGAGQPGSGGAAPATGGSTGSGGAATGGRGGAAGGGTGTGGAAGGVSGYNPCPTNGDPCRILPVGDSITFGINYEGAWRPEIFHRAVMAGQKITFTGTLQNGPTMVDGMPFPRRYEATSGITIDGISNQITSKNTLMMPADIILVHIGTNDMYMSPSGAPMRLGNLLDKLATGLPNALIVVAQIIPLGGSDSVVKTYNAAIPGIVQTRVAAGKHIRVLDLFTGFPAGGMDSVHPYQSGYNWMGDKFYDAISGLLPK